MFFFCTIARSFLHIMTHSRITLYRGAPIIVDRTKTHLDQALWRRARANGKISAKDPPNSRF
jgi:hypothetical protein